MIELDSLKPKYHQKILEISLTTEQTQFSTSPIAFLADKTIGIDHHVIKIANDVVGFFKLDRYFAEQNDFVPVRSLGLKTFVIDPAFQGQGIGQRAVNALPAYIKKHYPKFNTIYLTVNCKNEAAKHCYIKGGFIDSGELYYGGPVGPQHILYQDLSSSRF
ncbi:GNAT family N-acetyltransferase [Vibrio astriarenae]|uniref:GNAT family N-acetyltransferase n=1 Tax=Vibrio astriarenae TaxID=1481923 RepID=A0A7Z2T801_9VIBR|nr:GNAT family N-acetyltransferase [Vibrio astriarenae]QIA66081.1 GNAT family N-acetyltransferase [Vibrio astriarenae]